MPDAGVAFAGSSEFSLSSICLISCSISSRRLGVQRSSISLTSAALRARSSASFSMLHPSIKRVELEGDAGRPEIGVRNDRRNLAGKMEHRASVDRSGDAVGRDVSGDILRPSFSGIEAYDADGIFI